MPVEEENFAANLKAVRESAGLAQAALADAMAKRGFRWHQATVYKIENGERQVQLSEALAVADILGVPLTALIHAPLSSEELARRVKAVEYLLSQTTELTRQLARALKDLAVAVGQRIRTADADSPEMARANELLARTWHTELVMPFLIGLGFQILPSGPETPEQTLARIVRNVSDGRYDDEPDA
ncbi:helix-turn-helix domain-containing protein [Mycolicibacterium sp.]|uniref:helix-turn-helix domain-containing protein n=1 Tax=Mycolicibacterium sp. TaxID=2320850 RepID=UPI003D10BD09